uniref:CAZy families GH37 protein n=1 Tax=uncultured Citrobacter sp. TaxID=200446 RepID=A0A060CEP2_9ENTR|nr:CAZy families GH37 protein [uncultured Citrobacter sp.]
MEVSWRFLRNVQHTYDKEQKLVEKYKCQLHGHRCGGGEYPCRMVLAGLMA